MKNYTEELNLTFDPFEPGATAKGFFAGGNRQQVLDQLIEHSLYSQSVMAVTGCLGCGKTTLAKTYCNSFSQEAECVFIPATLFMNKTQFLEKLGEQIPVDLNDLETDSAVASIRSYASQIDLEAKALMIVIDDAHELSGDVLTLVTSLTDNGTTGIHIIFFGEMQLLSMLQNALSTRTEKSLMEIEIAELGGEDTVEYVKFKLAEAGFTGELPIAGAELGKIHNSANGIPGTINAMVANALEEAAGSMSVSQNLPAFISSGNRYWAAAAVLVILLVTALVAMDPDPRIDQQQAIANSEITIDAPLAARDPVDSVAAVDADEQTEIVQAEAVESANTPLAVLPASSPNESVADIQESELVNSASSTEEVSAELQSANTEIAESVPEIAKAEAHISAFEKSLLEFPATTYTVQIMGSHSEANVQRFIAEELASTERGYFETRFEDKPWFVVVIGHFDNRADATKAIEELPTDLQTLRPWVRTLADIQSDIRALNSIN